MNRWSALFVSVLVLIASVSISRHAHAQGGISVTYPAGWNLVGGPNGSVFNSVGNVYTFQSGNTAYESIDGSSSVAGGKGYWAYFPSVTSVTLNGIGSSSARIAAPAGQYIMIGNPSGTQSVSVTGADQVFVYDAVVGAYKQTTTLQVGQGAWTFSNAGGTVTVTPTHPEMPLHNPR